MDGARLEEMATGDISRLPMGDRSGRKPSAAAKLFRILSSFLTDCDARGLTTITLPKPRTVVKAVKPKTRYPDDERLVEIWTATEKLAPRSRALARTIFLTAQRKSTVQGMEWHELDLKATRWMIPAARMKAARPHEVRLSPFALAALHELRKGCRGRYVFGDGDRPPNRLKRILETISSAAPGDPWSWHDWRRSFLTWAVKPIHKRGGGFSREHAKIALAHRVKSDLDLAYDQHEYRDEAARVMLAWQSHIERLVTGGGGNVVELRRGGLT
jgi:integrase